MRHFTDTTSKELKEAEPPGTKCRQKWIDKFLSLLSFANKISPSTSSSTATWMTKQRACICTIHVSKDRQHRIILHVYCYPVGIPISTWLHKLSWSTMLSFACGSLFTPLNESTTFCPCVRSMFDLVDINPCDLLGTCTNVTTIHDRASSFVGPTMNSRAE